MSARSSRGRRSRPVVPGEPVPPVPVGEALADVGRELGLPAPGVVQALTARWPELVGPAVAEHAYPRALRRGVLTIVVDATPWATQLRYLETDLRSRAAAVLGVDTVREIRVVVEPRA